MKKLNQLLPSKLNLLGLFAIVFILGLFAFSKAIRPIPTASVAADKMNVFYIGIDNPITVAMAGVPSKKIKVTCEDADIEDLGNGHYNVQVYKPGKKTITVTDGTFSQEIIYRVKRIPDPYTTFANTRGGAVTLGKFQRQKGPEVNLNLPLEEKCKIIKFEMTHQSKDSDPVSILNDGAEFSSGSRSIVDNVKRGDVVYFDNILCECPGDPGGRRINSVVVKIK